MSRAQAAATPRSGSRFGAWWERLRGRAADAMPMHLPVRLGGSDFTQTKAAPVRVTLKDTHIKVDGCVGQSFLRSYAVLTSSTTDTDDIVAYYGVTKSV